jgi:hypothetical protein
VLADVVEHVVDPVRFLSDLAAAPALAGATWFVSVPNVAVWYNRARLLAGRFDYYWSGLYDRTHVRFFTRRSIRELLAYCGLEVVADRCSSALVHSALPILRGFFTTEVEQGDHLALLENPLYRWYQRFIEPGETAFCQVWPEMLGFQIVSVARRKT